MSMLVRISLLTIVLSNTACAPLVISREGESANKDGGIAYYLPKRLIKIQVDRAPAPTAKALEKAKADLATAKDEQKKSAAVSEAATKKLEKLGEKSRTSAAYLEQAKIVDLAKADAALLQAALDEAQAAYNEAMQSDLNATNGIPPLVDTITMTLLPPVADTDKRYIAVPNHLVSRSDLFTLKTNAAGLLSNADATAEDQTAAIIVAIAGAAAGAARIQYQTKDFTESKGEAACGKGFPNPPAIPRPFSVEYVIDPVAEFEALGDPIAKWGELSRFESLLCGLGANYRFRIARIGGNSAKDVAVDEGAPGLFYRREVPHLLSIYTKKDDAKDSRPTLSKAILLALPNKGTRELVRLEGGAFTTRVYATVFDNGILTSHSETKPSELLAIAKVPVEVMKAIFSVPTDLITLKVNYTNQQQDLAAAQKNLLDAARALDAARKQ